MVRKIIFFLFFIPFYLFSNDLAEKELKKLSLDEKIGQLFMIPLCPLREKEHIDLLEELIKKYHIGSVLVKKSSAKKQIDALNRLQKESKFGLLVASDSEWGLGMRMTDGMNFPKNMALGACLDDSLLYLMGKEVARQLKGVGVHINLAPVVDVNTNKDNPIINIRSFSDDPYLVLKKASILIEAMEGENILSCAKHFPGHGDVFVDPHIDLPVLKCDLKTLYKQEFVPFQEAIKKGVSCVMSAHIKIENLDEKPCSLSYGLISILRKDLGFNGLVISDALNMQALLKNYSVEDIALFAFEAGNDILLYGDHISDLVDDILKRQVPRAFCALKKAFLEKKLDEKKLDQAVLKILKKKFLLNLHKKKNISPYLQSKEALLLKEKLFQASLCTLKENEKFPFDIEKVFYLNLLEDEFLSKELAKQNLCLSKDKIIVAFADRDSNLEKLKSFDPLKVSVFWLDSPYQIKNFDDRWGLVIGFEKNEDVIKAFLDLILNKKKAMGKLPIALFE